MRNPPNLFKKNKKIGVHTPQNDHVRSKNGVQIIKSEAFLKLLCANLFRAIFLQGAIYQQNKASNVKLLNC